MNTINIETTTTTLKPTTTLRKRLSRAVFGALTVLTLAIAPLSMAHAGSVGGPEKDSGTIPAREFTVYRMNFKAGQVARIAAVGNIDLKVYDPNGKLITKDTSRDGAPVVTWKTTRKWTGLYAIEVINNGYHSVDYTMRTN